MLVILADNSKTMENTAPIQHREPEEKARIKNAFIQHVLETGHEPASVFKFAQTLNLRQEEFFQYYNSFKSIKSEVWDQIFDQTLAVMYAQEVYPSYAAQEKLLSFYFTWIEELKKNRSYFLSLYEHQAGFAKVLPSEVMSFKRKFKAFAKEIVHEGKATGEIVDRKFFSDGYEEGMWAETMFIFQFWLRDTSPGFEKTDAAIEKSVALAFDLIGRNAIDSLLDFAKFLYQSR